MAKVRESFVSGYLNNKMLEAVKSLNEIVDALDPVTEKETIDRVERIVKEIISIEL